MADFAKTMKEMMSRGAKFIRRTAHTAVSETKYKANEISLGNKRRELVNELGSKVLELVGNGLVLPQEAAAIVDQINKLDDNVALLRNDHAAKKAAAAEQIAMEKAARATEKAAAKAAAAIDMSTATVEVEAPAVSIDAEPAEEASAAPTLELDIEEAAEEEANPEVPTLNV